MGCYTASLQAVTPHVTTLAMTRHPLVDARKRAGLSQDALAALIGKDRITVLRIENGQQRPSLETVERIISALREKQVELSADAFLSERTGAAA